MYSYRSVGAIRFVFHFSVGSDLLISPLKPMCEIRVCAAVPSSRCALLVAQRDDVLNRSDHAKVTTTCRPRSLRLVRDISCWAHKIYNICILYTMEFSASDSLCFGTHYRACLLYTLTLFRRSSIISFQSICSNTACNVKNISSYYIVPLLS